MLDPRAKITQQQYDEAQERLQMSGGIPTTTGMRQRADAKQIIYNFDRQQERAAGERKKIERAQKKSAQASVAAVEAATQERKDTANKMMDFQREMYQQGRDDLMGNQDDSLEVTKETMQPWLNVGTESLERLKNKMAEGPGDYRESPGYKEAVESGVRGMENAAAARGDFFSGGAVRDIGEYTRRAKTEDYDRFLDRYHRSLQPDFQMAGMGLQAGGEIRRSSQNLGGQLAGLTQNLSGSMSNVMQYQGESGASGGVGAANVMANYTANKAEKDYGYAAYAAGDAW